MQDEALAVQKKTLAWIGAAGELACASANTTARAATAEARGESRGSILFNRPGTNQEGSFVSVPS